MIFLTGPHGAGKTTIANHLLSYNFDYVDLGGVLRSRHKTEMPSESFEKWCQVNEDIYGKNFTDDILVEEIKHKQHCCLTKRIKSQDLVIVGSRSMNGINYIINNVPLYNNKENLIVYINSSLDNLKERYCNREGVCLTEEQFHKILKRDEKIGILTIKGNADLEIDNNGNYSDFVKEMDKILLLDNCS